MIIKTEQGYIEYARFCGDVCEAWGYGKAISFPDRIARLIIMSLERKGITYETIARKPG